MSKFENLPISNLRSYLAIVEAGSMTRASKELNVTQSALSLQMKRLTEILGHSLFARSGNASILTPAGEKLALYARAMLDINDRAVADINARNQPVSVRIGIVQDLAAPLVSSVFARFMKMWPDANIRIRVGNTPNLHAEFDAGLLDIILVLGAPDEPHVARRYSVEWLGDERLSRLPEIPLAVMDAPCPFRDAAIRGLERAGLHYRMVLETPGISVLRAAVESGLALTCRTSNFFYPAIPQINWPGMSLGEVALVVRHNANAPVEILRLYNLIINSLDDVKNPGIYRW
ncbi:LysR family transcriptional regulator [Sphingobium sp. AN558]|uniref:LysR family transcriptional regulator n=1 Tax=Sphingobium sp. AN558 TaxID=3133442 RepID=UPI0030C1A2A5